MSTPGSDLPAHLHALAGMEVVDLRAEWCRLYRCHPPRGVRRDLLELGVAWKLQEAILGGLKPAARRRIAELSATIASHGNLATARTVMPKSGARLVREWRGETHDVIVLDHGFQWRGRTWRSLSKIAREITGTRWSGPRFFGLETSARDRSSPSLVKEATDA